MPQTFWTALCQQGEARCGLVCHSCLIVQVLQCGRLKAETKTQKETIDKAQKDTQQCKTEVRTSFLGHLEACQQRQCCQCVGSVPSLNWAAGTGHLTLHRVRDASKRTATGHVESKYRVTSQRGMHTTIIVNVYAQTARLENARPRCLQAVGIPTAVSFRLTIVVK